MVESIPKHLLEKLSMLFREFNTNEFRFQDAIRILGKDERYTGLILSQLGKAGWVSKRHDKDDGRKRFYRVNNVNDSMNQLGKNISDKD
jgi:hypothetical protein